MLSNYKRSGQRLFTNSFTSDFSRPSSPLFGADFLTFAEFGRFIHCVVGAFLVSVVFKFIRVSLHEWRLFNPESAPSARAHRQQVQCGASSNFFDLVTFLRMTTDFIRGVYRGESPCRFIEFSLKFCLSFFLRFSSFFHACLVKVAFTLTMRFNSSLFSEFIFSVCFLLRAVDASCIR